MTSSSSALAAATWLALAMAGPAAAQPPADRFPVPPLAQPPPPIIAPLLGSGGIGCRPGDTRRGCRARRRTLQPTLPEAARPLGRTDDLPATRFVPPKILAFLNDPRISAYTRSFLRYVAGKPTEDWTLGELEMVTQLAPTLTELYVPTAVLSDFYEFLGLDPTSLFEPKLGNWQQRSTAFDPKNYDATQQAQCFYLLGYGENLDPSSVKLKDVAACSAASGTQP